MTHGWQSESTEGLKGDWSLSLFLSLLLSFSLFLWLSTYLPTDLSIYLSIYLYLYLSIISIYLTIYLSIYLSIYPSIYLSIHLSIYLSISLSLSIYLPVYLQAWKPCHSTRLLHFSKLTTSKTQHFCETSSFLKLTTSKTKQFCETSSFFEVDHIKNKASLRDFLQKWKFECRANSFVPMRFAFCDFSSPPVESTAPATKKWCQVKRSAAPVTQNHLSKPEDLMLQNAAPLRKSAPWPPNISDEHVFCTAPATRNASLKILPHVFLTFDKVHNPLRLPRESTSERPKVLRARQFFALLTLKCASRHNGVHFFDIATSKSGSKLVCFVHFDFETCFAPQQRAIFHLSSGQMAPHPPL